MTIANTTTVIRCEGIKVIPIFFLSDRQKYNLIFGVPQNFSHQFMSAVRGKGWKSLPEGMVGNRGPFPSWGQFLG